jgi:hypothetical protein
MVLFVICVVSVRMAAVIELCALKRFYFSFLSIASCLEETPRFSSMGLFFFFIYWKKLKEGASLDPVGFHDQP